MAMKTRPAQPGDVSLLTPYLQLPSRDRKGADPARSLPSRVFNGADSIPPPCCETPRILSNMRVAAY